MALGLAIILWHSITGFTSLATLATVMVWLPNARGETATPWFSATRLRSAVAAGATLIWLPWARGESGVVLALTLRVIAARAAMPMVIRSEGGRVGKGGG